MSKKEALGSIPTFEDVAIATEELDLFKEEKEEKQNTQKDLEKQLKEDLRKQVLKDAEAKREALKKETKPKKRITDKEIQETIEEPKVEEVEPRRTAGQLPSTKKGVRTGYKRQTFVIREDLLEIIQALCSINKEIMQVDLLEKFIVDGLANIKEETKQKALASYRKEQKEGKQEQAKKEIDKLFK